MVIVYLFVIILNPNSILFVVIKVDGSHMLIFPTSPLLLGYEICDLNKIVNTSKSRQ